MTAPPPNPDAAHDRAIDAALDEYLASKGKPWDERMKLWTAVLDADKRQKRAGLTTAD